MARIVEDRLGTEDDPGYYPGLIIGPVRVSKKSTETGKQESKPEKAEKAPKARKATGKDAEKLSKKE